MADARTEPALTMILAMRNGMEHEMGTCGDLDGRLAWLRNGSCHYEEALVAAERGLAYSDELGLATWSAIELVEAAVRTGRMEKAHCAVDRLCQTIREDGTDLGLGIVARCLALVSSDADAEDLYLEAIDRLSRTTLHVEMARAQLLYGEWLRRNRRRVDARRQLRVALETFKAMGVHSFAERTSRELLATGETVRKRDVDAFRDLTPQESEVARLAGSGFSNAEIALRLFLSERTVEWHLGKVFVKLGVRSRWQLRDELPPDSTRDVVYRAENPRQFV